MVDKDSLGLWEVRFIVEGMPLPEDKISEGIFSFERLSIKEFEIFWLPALAKVKVEGTRKNIKELGKRRLQDFLALYAFRVDYAIRIVRDYGASQLTIYEPRRRARKVASRKTYGASISPSITFRVTEKKKPEFLKKELRQANKNLKAIDFSSKQNAYLRTALDYLLYSETSPRKEEELIALVISLEALFSGGNQELSYSIAHRAASLLGNNNQKRGQIFEDIREIYKERSQIVHKGYSKYSDCKTREHIRKGKEYAKEAIKKFLLLTPKYSREEIHKKLDVAIRRPSL